MQLVRQKVLTEIKDMCDDWIKIESNAYTFRSAVQFSIFDKSGFVTLERVTFSDSANYKQNALRGFENQTNNIYGFWKFN